MRPVTWLASTSSGRSMGVAPSKSAAPRTLMTTSPWLAKPAWVFSGPFSSCTSGIHSPVPSASKRAQYRVPSSSRSRLAAGFFGSKRRASRTCRCIRTSRRRPCTRRHARSCRRWCWRLRAGSGRAPCACVGIDFGSCGSISTIQPKRKNSLGSARRVEARVLEIPVIEAMTSRSGKRRSASLRAASCVSRIHGGAGEVVVDVFLGREVGAPGRLARRAVGEGAQHARAGGISVGAHQRMAARGAMDIHGRARGDAAVVRRGQVACASPRRRAAAA